MIVVRCACILLGAGALVLGLTAIMACMLSSQISREEEDAARCADGREAVGVGEGADRGDGGVEGGAWPGDSRQGDIDGGRVGLSAHPHSKERDVSESVRDVARRILADKPVFLDTETTGLGPSDQVVELGIVDIDGVVLLSTLVKPTIAIPAQATAIHGITDEMVADAPSLADLQEQVCELMRDRLVVIYNAEYDLKMLSQSARAHGLGGTGPAVRWWCAMKLYSEHAGEWNPRFGNYRWFKLEEACRREGVELPEELHRAAADAEATRRLLVKLAEQSPEVSSQTAVEEEVIA